MNPIDDINNRAEFLKKQMLSDQQTAQVMSRDLYQGQLGCNKRQTISQRIDYQLQDANFHADKLGKLRELSNLLAEFPHVARILDLLEEVR